MATRTRNHTRPRSPSQQPKKKSADVVKFMVTGLSQSGKTSFIKTMSQYTEWQNEPGKSWFFGRVRVDDSLILHFYEPPMDRQFDFMWLRDIMGRMRATGFIVMADSTRPQDFGQFLSILYTVRGFHASMPIIVAANKQDSSRAWSAEDIELGLGLRDFTVIPCIANEYDTVRDIVVELLYQVLNIN